MEELVGELLGELVLKLLVGAVELVVLELLRRFTRAGAGPAGLAGAARAGAGA